MVLNNLNSILIIRLSSLGDILLTTPLLRSLVKQYPGIKIDFLIKEQYSDAIRYNPNIRSIFSYNSSTELVNGLQSNSYDLVLDLQNNSRSNKITSGLNIPIRKFKKRSLDKFLLVNFSINNLKEATQIPGRYSHTIPGFELDNTGNEIFFPPDTKPEIPESAKNIGIAPGSRHLTKMWPKEYYVVLAKMLVSQGYNIFLFGGKSDREICRQITLESGSAVDLSNEDNILGTAINMAQCSLVICNDSGLMHTATAVNVPVCVFFGSTVKEFGFTPYKTKNLILENKLLSCRPCSHIGRKSCPLGHFRCMLEITPKVAFERILTLLNS